MYKTKNLVVDLSWVPQSIWKEGSSEMFTETRDRVKWSSKQWDRSWSQVSQRVVVGKCHLIWREKLQIKLHRNDSRLGSLIILSGTVHTKE